MGSDVRHVRGEAQKELVKKFEVFSSNGRSRWQVWSDWITMSAIAVSNATDQSHFDEREKQYLSIAKKYTRPEMEAFTEMLALLVVALEDNPEQDFLGELYMCLSLGNDHAGQFFTPYDELKAKLAEIGFSIVQEVGLVTSVREMDEFYSKQEPALRDFYTRMKAYVPSAFLTAFMAIPFPREAKELLFIVQKPKGEENNG